jgi:predicted nucleotidyltransferase
MNVHNIEMIQEVAKALQELNNDVVFVGGSTVALYLNLDTADEIRPTDDVDVIIEIFSAAKYSAFSEKLLALKFSPDQSKNAPICRWKYLGIIVDIMPLDEKVLGFSNKYYKSGFKHKEVLKLPNGQTIFILPLAYFLATKLEAFYNRGAKDPRFSKDLEDIVALLSESQKFNAVFDYDNLVEVIRPLLATLFNNENIIEAMRSFLQSAVAGQFDLIKQRAKLKKP